MRRILQILSATVGGLFIAASVFAQTATPPGGQQQPLQQKQEMSQQKAGQQDLITSDWLLGKTVYSPQAEDLGDITKLFINERNGQIGYVQVTTGGIFSLSGETHIVPYRALNIKEDRVVLNMDKAKLAQAPVYREGIGMKEFNRESEEFFGISEVWGDEEYDWFDWGAGNRSQ